MKSIQFILIAALTMVTVPLIAQQTPLSKTDTIKVYGNCGMCKNRIQKALKMDGIQTTDWNRETKLLVVSYDPSKISNDSIQKKIAEAGHDTEKYMADDKVYENLPGCCHYERRKTTGAEPTQSH